MEKYRLMKDELTGEIYYVNQADYLSFNMGLKNLKAAEYIINDKSTAENIKQSINSGFSRTESKIAKIIDKDSMFSPHVEKFKRAFSDLRARTPNDQAFQDECQRLNGIKRDVFR